MKHLTMAVAVINRNLPTLTDELVERIMGLGDALYVIENGSDSDKRSKHANVVFDESKGVSFAVNAAVQKAIDAGHDLVWVNYNDARFVDPEAYVRWSKTMFDVNPRLALTTGHWPNVWDDVASTKCHDGTIVSFFDPISFIVSTAAVREAAAHDPRLTPFWDASNYTAHYNILGPALAFYETGRFMACDTRHPVLERDVFQGADKDDVSLVARGHTDSQWKTVEGPKSIGVWMSSFFPEAKGGNDKHRRDTVIRQICALWHGSDGVAKFVG